MSPKGAAEVFAVVKKGEGYKLEMNRTLADALKTDDRAKTHVKGIEKLLDMMAKQAKEYGMSAQEQKALWHALKDKFERESGLKTGDIDKDRRLETARKLTDAIFNNVNQTIGKKLEKYADIVEWEVVGAADKGDFEDIMKKISPEANEDDLAKLWARFQAPEAPESQGKPNLLAAGRRAIRDRGEGRR